LKEELEFFMNVFKRMNQNRKGIWHWNKYFFKKCRHLFLCENAFLLSALERLRAP
jgi:hypothetical protein